MRVHDVMRFRAVGIGLDWLAIARPRLEGMRNRDELISRLKKRRNEVRLAWGCSQDLGVPHDAFTVWTRQHRTDALTRTEFSTFSLPEGELVWWAGEEAAQVRVTVAIHNPTRPVGLFLLRTGTDPAGALGAHVVDPAGVSTKSLDACAGAATHAVLINGHAISVRIRTVTETIEADDWRPLERVGLPVDGPELAGYSPDDQGLTSAPTHPIKAALERLQRVGAPLGWYPTTESGRLAPPWLPPDAHGLIEETRRYLLPELNTIYDPALPESDQQVLETRREVAPPSRSDGTTVNQPATATLSPLSLLLLPAGSDPSLNLVTGFGSGYQRQHLPDHLSKPEFLITAPYRSSVLGDGVEVAAYVPPVHQHASVPPVVDLRAERAALLPPLTTDAPFRESVEVSWRPTGRRASLTDPVAHAFAGWGGGATVAEDLLPERPLGGPQYRVIPQPETTTILGGDRPKAVHADLKLPIDGSVSRGYAVAQTDLFGLWSRWEDVERTAGPPRTAPPRIARLDLASTWVGTSVCPSRLTADLAVDWTQRSPRTLELQAVFYPMPTGRTPPPPGLTANGPIPADCHAAGTTATFTGDTALAAGAAVIEPLRDDGSLATTWGAAEQGAESRKYRLSFDSPGLDFAPVSRWGVQVWVRQAASGIAAPSMWAPVPEHPATAVAASPVPAVPLPSPLPPGVPLGSTPDAQGLSHVKVTWSGLSSPHVHGAVIWEASETTLRQHLELENPVDRNTLLGDRLQELWDHYDAAPAERRPLGFRRAAEVPATPAAADLTLPRGSEDIHLFLVTAVTTTGLESKWPEGTSAMPPHAHLQAAAAPRLRRPAMPLVRSEVQANGSVAVRLESSSPIPVTAFEIFATRSETAARDHLTMGPPIATVSAAPGVDPNSGDPVLDPITGQQIWRATWSGALPGYWEPWHLRAVAVPVPTVEEAAERGLTSAASDVTVLAVLPETGPTLDPLRAEVVDTDHRGLLVRTATSATDRTVPAGPHRVQVTVAGTPTTQDLAAVHLVPDASAPPATSGGTVVRRLARSAGHTPLLIWTHRDDPTQPTRITVRVNDPLGRSTEEVLQLPGWIDPVPELTLDIVDVVRITGRGYTALLRTSANPHADPPYTLTVVAMLPRTRPPRRNLRGSWALSDIPGDRSLAPPRTGGITAVRTQTHNGTEINLWIRAAGLTGLRATITHPLRGQIQQSWAPGR